MIGVLLSLVMVAMLCSCEPEIDDNNTQTTPTTPDTPNTPTDTVVCGETVGEWVDLGLPSGLLWYSVNLGATSPEQYGDYYAWGETRPKSDYRCSTYRYCTVDADNVLVQVHHGLPPILFDVVFQFTTVLPIVIHGTQSVVDFTGWENEAIFLGMGNDFFE